MPFWTYWTLVTIYALAAVCCVLIAWQDFRHREVSLWLFVGLAGLGLAKASLSDQGIVVLYAIANSLLVMAVLGMVWLWMRILRKGTGGKLFLGAGDIAMLEVFACWMNVQSFVLFFVASVWIILLGTIAWRTWRKLGSEWPIPLAGCQAVLFIPLLAFLCCAQIEDISGFSGFGIESMATPQVLR